MKIPNLADMPSSALESLEISIIAELQSRWCDDCHASCGSRGAPTGCIDTRRGVRCQ
jgi:hypothetical protein